MAFWYRIVSPSEAHLVATQKERFVASPDEKIATNGRRAYFAFPKSIPFIGRDIRVMDMTIKEVLVEQETYEKAQARYKVSSSTKYRIANVKRSAETFVDDETLKDMLVEVIKASVRAVTVKYDVKDARANKQEMGQAINDVMLDDLQGWGLELVNFQLVDFQDTADSTVISDISKRREVEIQSITREQNAEKIKQARMKEAESEEKAKQREIEKDRVIGEQEQIKAQLIAEKEKIAKEKEFEVIRVETVKQAEIDKEKAIVKANEDKETEVIRKDQKQLEGEGDRLRAEEQAKGDAAPIREKGFAEAEAKDKLQAALNKFGDKAITALVAEQVVEKERQIGIEAAKALEKAELKVFAGSKSGEDGFNLGQIVSAIQTTDAETAASIRNKLARPQDLGLVALKKTNDLEAKVKKGKAK